MKVCIAARFGKKQEVKDLHKLILEKGHEIVGDWTLHKPIKPYEENHELARKYSIEDIEDVIESDVFILLSDKDGTGMYIELGAAIFSYIILGKPKIYVIGDYINRSMFYFHPSVNRRENIKQVLEEISH